VTEPAETGKVRARRGLFRRKRASADGDPGAEFPAGRDRGRDRADDQVPAHDEEYVDWVSGLSGRDPEPDDQPDSPTPRRTLNNPPGRHHAD
jgi:hypothetical protein